MKKVTLGRTGLVVGQMGLELSPMRKLSFAECKRVLDKSLEYGVNFLDLGLPERETQKRIGHSIAGRRSELILAGSFIPKDKETLRKDLQWMLRDLKTDYLDLLQIHDPDFILRPGEESGLYDALLSAKKDGYIRNIGITTGDPLMAMDCLEYGWYDTLQYPWSRSSDEAELAVLECCKDAEVGSINVPMEEIDEDVEEHISFLKQFENHMMLWMIREEDFDRVLR